LGSWIESFVEWGDGLESPEIFRLWSAITIVGAALEQRVFVLTHRPLYANLYTLLIGPPGVGKSVSIGAITGLARQLQDFHIGPISVTGASLVDAMAAAKCKPINYTFGDPLLEYNSITLVPDDLQALLSDYNAELVALLTVFYDNTPYSQSRRVSGLHIEIPSPQLTILAGTTPSQLLHLLKPEQWDQGFMARTIMIHAATSKINADIFAQSSIKDNADLVHDLEQIHSLRGQLAISPEFGELINAWRQDPKPIPTHPRLRHYCSRRSTHLLKLAMVSCADRGDILRLEKFDFERGLKWLCAAERAMPGVFEEAVGTDSKVMKDIIHSIGQAEILEKKLKRLISERVSAHMVSRMLELMISTGYVKHVRVDSQGNNFYRVIDGS
jgi:hypothetical protein